MNPRSVGRAGGCSVAPVEVARTAPEIAFGVRLGKRRIGLLTGRPGEDELVLCRDGLGARERLLEAGLLLRLEQRVILEWVLRSVLIDRHLPLEPGVTPLELEMLLDHLGERQCSIQRHPYPLSLTKRPILNDGPVDRAALCRFPPI